METAVASKEGTGNDETISQRDLSSLSGSPFISVVIPVYKAGDCLNELYSRLSASLQALTERYEIILVEDCGGDNSWPIILDLHQRDQRVKGIQFSRNFGQHCGITAGLDCCDTRTDWVVVMDCDLQDRPEEIQNLLRKAQEGYEIVRARRVARKDPGLKLFFSWMFYKFFNYMTGMGYDGASGNFMIVSRKVLDNLLRMREQVRFFGGLVAWMGFPSASVDVRHGKRFSGESSYSLNKLYKLGWDIIISYSNKPLRLMVRCGALVSVFAALYGFYIISRKIIFGGSVVGWSSIIVSLYFLAGIIISTLGVVGIYLGKVFEEAKNRPIYIINRTTGNVATSEH